MKYPISPDYLANIPDKLAAIWQDLEDYIIVTICERLNASGLLNNTALELIRELQRRGLPLAEIEQRIKKTLKLSEVQLSEVFEDAIERNQIYYSDLLTKAGLVEVVPQMEALQAEADAIARQTAETFENLTQTLGFSLEPGSVAVTPIQQSYEKALDDAAMRVLSGGTSYEEAIRESINRLTESGIQFVDYASGHRDRADVAARRAVRTGVAQISSKYTDQAAEKLETQYFEVSAHAGARDKGDGWQNHKDWQGKVYSMRAGDKYPSIYEVCGLGEVDGLEGANCRHRYFPFVDGVSERTYTDEELANIDPEPFTYQGKEYSFYEATQRQRQIERTLRAVKRRLLGEKAAGLEDAYKADAAYYVRLNDEYVAFSKAAGLRTQEERSFIQEFGPREAREARKAAAAH